MTMMGSMSQHNNPLALDFRRQRRVPSVLFILILFIMLVASRIHGLRQLSVVASRIPQKQPTTTRSLRQASVSCQTHRQSTSSASSATTSSNDSTFFSESDNFSDFVASPVLLQRLERLGLERPTAIQAAAMKALTDNKIKNDIIVGAETGSGKTLAYLLPLLDDILCQKREMATVQQQQHQQYDYARAIILVPNKELVQQVVRMALPLAGGKQALVWGGSSSISGSYNDNDVDDSSNNESSDSSVVDPADIVRIAVLPGGLNDPLDFKPFRESIGLSSSDEQRPLPPPVDLLVSTPAALAPLGLKPKHVDLFADVQTLVVDEADMLLDGGYIRALENVLMGFRRADRLAYTSGSAGSAMTVLKTQHVFVAATLPDSGLRSVDAYLTKRFPHAVRVTTSEMHNARHYGLSQPTLWLREESKKARMEKLVELLSTPSTKDVGNADGAGTAGLQGEKTMVFLNSVDDVEAACQALVRAGVADAVPYHAKMALADRSRNLERFSKYDKNKKNNVDAVSVLVCTDLASRGLDVSGVNAIVQLQFAGNVVAHLHRMGRCGRAGNKTGRGIVFFGDQERKLVEVVRRAEQEQERMVLQGDVQELVLDLEKDIGENDDDDDDDDDADQAGKVKKAFSRKRGFTKKIKKLRREQA